MKLTRGMAVLALSVLSAACSRDGEARRAHAAPATEPEAAVAELTVTAADFHFEAPASVPAGRTRIRLINKGTEPHHVQLVKFEDGHTLEEFMEGVAAGGPPPPWVSWVGGPNTPMPGAEAEATLNLEPGSYALLCGIPSPDGVPHIAKGMVKPLTVTPAEKPSAAEPPADVHMVLDDYGYEITPEIRAGRRTIRVENVAEQPHEVILAKLAPGKTLHDVMEFFGAHGGPPPFAFVGGTTALGKGEVNHITAQLDAGEYALICMIPDAKDGKPHIAHGMVRQITVS